MGGSSRINRGIHLGQVSLGVERDLSGEPHAIIYPFEKPVTIAGEERKWLNVKHYCFDLTLTPQGKSAVTVLTNTTPPSIRMLMAMVDSMDMHEGLRQSLLAKLNAALAALERGRVNTAKNILGAFINEVEAQSGKKLTEEQADVLMDVALAVIGSLDDAHPAPAKDYRIGPEGKLTTIWGQMKVR